MLVLNGDIEKRSSRGICGVVGSFLMMEMITTVTIIMQYFLLYVGHMETNGRQTDSVGKMSSSFSLFFEKAAHVGHFTHWHSSEGRGY